MRASQQSRTRNIKATFDTKTCSVHAMIVSRSASHIASTLSESQRNNALAEAIAEVRKDYGDKSVEPFLDALKEWFNQRDYRVAAELSGYFQRHGCLPEIEQSASPRRRIARGTSKAESTLSARAA